MMAESSERPSAGGVARRRRERRRRSWWRHEQQTVRMALAAFSHHSAQRQKTARAGGGVRDAVHGEALLPKEPGTRYYDLCGDDSVLELGGSRPHQRRSGYSGTPSSRASRPSRPFRFSMLLCRRWGLSWWNSCRSLTLRPRNRLWKCPSSLKIEFHSALWRVRRWRNSWWKCPRSRPSFLFSSRLRSKSLTFRFLIAVVVVKEVFKVNAQNRVQQHRFLRNAFLSGLWSTTSTFQFLVVKGALLVCKVFFPVRVQQRSRNALLSYLWSSSAIFPVEAFKIFAQNRVHLFFAPALEVGTASALEPMDAGCL